MSKKPSNAGMLIALVLTATAVAGESTSLKSYAPENAEVYIIEPADQAIVSTSFRIVFGLRGMGVAPAGVNIPATGHHHLLIDQPQNLNYKLPLPSSKRVLHFGKGQTEAVIELPPGDHQLQLVLGNYVHIPHVQPVESKVIVVHVKK